MPPGEEDRIEDFEDLFDNAPCGYISARPDGRIARVNRTFATWLGSTPEALTGRRFQELLNIAGRIYYETHFVPLLRMQGFFNEVALDLVRPDGTALPVLVNAVERRDIAGAATFIRMTIFNATDRRRYERELLEARNAAERANADLNELNRTLETRIAEAVQERSAAEEAMRQAQKMEAIGQLTGGVAHDFNNLLTIIRSSADLLRRREVPEEKRRRYIDAISDTADRAAKLTGQLLAFARRQALEPKLFNVGERVGAIAEIARTLAGSRVAVTVEILCEDCLVEADVSQFETAVINLAVNARDAMDDQGCLTIRVAAANEIPPVRGHAGAQGAFAAISVIDTGHGIAADKLSQIFQPFFTTKSVGKGTGLGLSQVYGFAKQSGGEVQVETESGKGTTFTIYLPRSDRVLANADAGDAPPSTQALEMRVLVVEDNNQVGEFSTSLLQEMGHNTTWAADARSALKLVEEGNAFDIVFTDVVLPGMSGIELARHLRRHHPELPVVLTSGYSHVLAEEGTYGFDLLRKPYSVEALASILRRALDRLSPRSRA